MDAIDLTRLAPPQGDRIAIVGGCGGIGRALVAACRANGLEVAVLDLPQALAQHPVPEGVAALPIDLLRPESIGPAFADLAQGWAGLEHLAVLSGFSAPLTPVADTEPAAWRETLAGNLDGAMLAAQAALPLLRAGHEGLGRRSILLTGSGLGSYARPGFAPYSAAKAGLLALTRSLALELAPDIRANLVAPGAVDTAFNRGGTGRGAGAEGPSHFTDLARYAEGVPMRRAGTPEDVVGPMLFLMSLAARHMTGQTLHVNGGGLMP